jgi:tyrosine aminotransferase
MGYPFFTDVCPALGVKAVPYKLVKERNFEMDLVDAQSKVNHNTQFIFVINPTNPMGTIFSEEHMK